VSADAIVVGAGICGACAAHFLSERGLDVLILDRAGVSEGTTGLGEGNVLVSDKAPGVERDLAMLGRDLWNELGGPIAAARVTPKGALVLGHPDGGDVRDREPALGPAVRALYVPGELQVDPRGLTRALVEPLTVRTGSEVVAVEPGAVRLAGGERLTATHVIVATGPWARELTGLPVEPRKGQLVALGVTAPLLSHKLFEASYAAVAASGDSSLQTAVVVEQTLDGDEVLVGSSRERVGFDPTVSSELSRTLIERAAVYIPALSDLPVTRAWCGFRPWLPDGLPAVGPLDERLWVTTGHEGSGVGLGPVTGLMLAQMIVGERPEFDPAPLHPRRFAAGAVGR
jgi:D-hydroxyproline dehydrogenase subunit beta